MVWDPPGTAGRGLRRGLWATRKLLLAFAVSTLLTWREWAEHHPPEIAIAAVIHFVFVFALIALLVYARQRFGGNGEASPSEQEKRL